MFVRVGWMGSEAQKLCVQLVYTASHEVPGYSDAPWGID